LLSQGFDGVRIGAGDGVTLHASGNTVVAGWEGTDFYNRPVWFARSTDGGSSWEAALRADPDITGERAYAVAAPFPDGRVAEAWIVYEEGTGTPDIEWTAQDSTGAFGPPLSPAVLSPAIPCECCNPDQVVLDDGQTVLIAYRNNDSNRRNMYVARSTDGGASFVSSTKLDTGNWFFPACPSTGPAIAHDGQDVVIVWKKSPGNSHHIWSARSSDGGSSWSTNVQIDDSDGSTGANYPAIAMRGAVVVAVWEARDPVTGHPEAWGVASTDAGATWGVPAMVPGDGANKALSQTTVAISPSLEVELAWRDSRDGPSYIYRTRGSLGATGVDVAVPAGSDAPSARPNPFAGGTTIEFQRSESGVARLTVHDASGRVVARLPGVAPGPGVAQVRWDGKDTAGKPVAAGVYLLRLESAGGVSTGRVTRLR
jgi:hypothetical protein